MAYEVEKRALLSDRQYREVKAYLGRRARRVSSRKLPHDPGLGTVGKRRPRNIL